MKIGLFKKIPGIRGLRQRWMANSVFIVVLVIMVIIFVFTLFISNYYYSAMRIGLETKAKTASDFFANYITKSYAEFYDSAYSYTESFEDRNKLELQFIDTEGRGTDLNLRNHGGQHARYLGYRRGHFEKTDRGLDREERNDRRAHHGRLLADHLFRQGCRRHALCVKVCERFDSKVLYDILIACGARNAGS